MKRVEARGLCYSYGRGQALEDVSLYAERGEFVGEPMRRTVKRYSPSRPEISIGDWHGEAYYLPEGETAWADCYS